MSLGELLGELNTSHAYVQAQDTSGALRIGVGLLGADFEPIDGYYRTAEDMEPSLRSRPIQAWLQGDVMLIAPLN